SGVKGPHLALWSRLIFPESARGVRIPPDSIRPATGAGGHRGRVGEPLGGRVMEKGIGSTLTWAALGLGLGLAATAARGQQVIERDTKLTGPRGRTIERDIRVERGP